MKINPPQTLSNLAKLISATPIGDPNHLITGINEIHRVEPGDLTFVDVEKYYSKSFASQATTILINKHVEPPLGKALLVCEDPFNAYNFLTEFFQKRIGAHVGTPPNLNDPSIKIGKNVTIGENTFIGSEVEIGHNVVIGSNCIIGKRSIIYSNVTIYENTIIGENVCIQSGAVIGAEAFYFKKRSYGRDKMLTKGRVIIEDFVEIGANTTIDRGVSSDTIIGEQTKIDNLVQIGHDTIIGKRCVIAAQVGIAGVCEIKDDVILWGQVGIASDVQIGNGTVILAQSGVYSDLEGGKTYFGSPVKEHKQKWREYLALAKLPQLIAKMEADNSKIDSTS